MNRIARTLTNLTIATGMATAALTLGSTAAHAETPAPKPGPVIVLPPSDPQPPKGPGDIKVPTPDPQPPKGPKDLKAPLPKPQPPKGPKDLSNGETKPQDPKPQAGDDSAAAAAAESTATGATAPTASSPDAPAPSIRAAVETVSAFQTGGRTFDTGLSGLDDAAVVAADEDGSGTTWLLAGLGLAGATGLVLVAARRRKAAKA